MFVSVVRLRRCGLDEGMPVHNSFMGWLLGVAGTGCWPGLAEQHANQQHTQAVAQLLTLHRQPLAAPSAAARECAATGWAHLSRHCAGVRPTMGAMVRHCVGMSFARCSSFSSSSRVHSVFLMLGSSHSYLHQAHRLLSTHMAGGMWVATRCRGPHAEHQLQSCWPTAHAPLKMKPDTSKLSDSAGQQP